jgi:hypothetical protein
VSGKHVSGYIRNSESQESGSYDSRSVFIGFFRNYLDKETAADAVLRAMKILVCSFLVLAGFVSAFSQEKTIDKSEFDAVYEPSTNQYLKWKGRTFRQTVTTETRATGRPATDYSSKSVTEFGLGGTVRAVYESTFGGKASTKRESIRIGDVRFERSGDGEWTKRVQQTDSAIPPQSPVEVISIQTEYKFLGNELYKNKMARTYSTTDKEISVSKSSGSTTEKVRTTKYWFDQDGTLVKSDFRSNSKIGELAIYTGVIIEWELDPSIAIVAPIPAK